MELKTLEPRLEFARGNFDDPKLFEELAERLRSPSPTAGPGSGLLPRGVAAFSESAQSLAAVAWAPRRILPPA